MGDREHTIKWLEDAIKHFEFQYMHAATRWVAEQNHEREKACRAALLFIKGQHAGCLCPHCNPGDQGV